MNNLLKRVLLGFQMWLIPLAISFLIWDIHSNSPFVTIEVFKGIMGLFLGVGFSIALYFWLRDLENRTFYDCFGAGVFWFLMLSILDFIVIYWLMKNSIEVYISIVLMYLLIPIVMFGIGLSFKK